MNIRGLEERISRAWGSDTCYPGMWDASKPEKGQCAVTAMAVYSLLGGKIMRASKVISGGIDCGSHYWNLLPGGYEADFTRTQFHLPEFFDVSESSAERILSNEDTKKRFEILMSRIGGTP